MQSVLELIREGLSFETILQDYCPTLTLGDLKACVQYALVVVA